MVSDGRGVASQRVGFDDAGGGKGTGRYAGGGATVGRRPK